MVTRPFADKIIPVIINAAPIKWKFINFSLKIIIAIRVLKIGIRCKNIPDLLEPIIEIPLIQKKKKKLVLETTQRILELIKRVGVCLIYDPTLFLKGKRVIRK